MEPVDIIGKYSRVSLALIDVATYTLVRRARPPSSGHNLNLHERGRMRFLHNVRRDAL
jgi:hypothetical protein